MAPTSSAYMGSAKIMAQIGKGFAEAIAAMVK
jgi:hypothetical protein